MAQEAPEAPTGPESGKALYARECLSCHMRDGRGVPGMSPALLASPWVLGSADALIGFVLSGGFGPDSLMASFGYLGDGELAELLTYVRVQFGNDTNAITPEQVARARATFGTRGGTAPE